MIQSLRNLWETVVEALTGRLFEWQPMHTVWEHPIYQLSFFDRSGPVCNHWIDGWFGRELFEGLVQTTGHLLFFWRRRLTSTSRLYYLHLITNTYQCTAHTVSVLAVCPNILKMSHDFLSSSSCKNDLWDLSNETCLYFLVDPMWDLSKVEDHISRSSLVSALFTSLSILLVRPPETNNTQSQHHLPNQHQHIHQH